MNGYILDADLCAPPWTEKTKKKADSKRELRLCPSERILITEVNGSRRHGPLCIECLLDTRLIFDTILVGDLKKRLIKVH